MFLKNYCIPFFLFFVGVSKSIAWSPLYFHHVPIPQRIKNHKSNIVHLDTYDSTAPIGTKTFGFAESEEESMMVNFFDENGAKNSKTRENKNVSKYQRGPLRSSTRKISELLPSIDSLDDQTILDNYLNERENPGAIVVPRKPEKRVSTKFKKKKNGFKHKSNE